MVARNESIVAFTASDPVSFTVGDRCPLQWSGCPTMRRSVFSTPSSGAVLTHCSHGLALVLTYERPQETTPGMARALESSRLHR